MTDAQIKSAAVSRLKAAGVEVPARPGMMTLARLIEQHTGLKLRYGNSHVDFVHAYAVPPHATPKQVTFKPLVASPHPRAADIDAAQPPVMTPNGIGNDRQFGGFIAQAWRR